MEKFLEMNAILQVLISHHELTNILPSCAGGEKVKIKGRDVVPYTLETAQESNVGFSVGVYSKETYYLDNGKIVMVLLPVLIGSYISYSHHLLSRSTSNSNFSPLPHDHQSIN